MHSLPILFHPTSTVFIDDDVDALESLVDVLELEESPHRTFYSPPRGLDFINADTYREEMMRELLPFDEGEIFMDTVAFHPQVLMERLAKVGRYQQISVIVIDYEMPGMRGLDLIQQIRNPHIKKILLTGMADERIAVDAFNRGLIDQYVKKHDSNFVAHLARSLETARHQYFEAISEVPLKILSTRQESTALIEPLFIDYFKSLQAHHKIKEYTLAEGLGSFVMISETREIFSLVTLDDGVIETYLTSRSGESLTREQRAAVEARDLVPTYYSPFQAPHFEPLQTSLEMHLHKPVVIEGSTKNFYCVFGKNLIQIPESRIALF